MSLIEISHYHYAIYRPWKGFVKKRGPKLANPGPYLTKQILSYKYTIKYQDNMEDLLI